VLEVGLVERHAGATMTALLFPAILLVLSVVGHRDESVYRGFLDQYRARLGGTPLFLTLLASSAFYGYAALRGVRPGTEFLTGMLALLAVAGPSSLDFRDLAEPQPLPILAVAALQLGLGLRRRDAWRCLVGASALVLGASLVPTGLGGSPYRGAIAFHLLLASALIVGAAFDDRLGRLVRDASALLAAIAGLVAMTGQFDGVPRWATLAYPVAMAALLAGYGRRFRHRLSLAAAGLIASAWLLGAALRGYVLLRQMVAGLDYLALGMILFVLAVLTSMAKGGVLPLRHLKAKRGLPDSSG
jgi:hypothetical protein